MNNQEKKYDVGFIFESTGKSLICEDTIYRLPKSENDLKVLYKMAEKLDENWDVERAFDEGDCEKGATLYKINPKMFMDLYLSNLPDYMLRVFDSEYENGEMMLFINSDAVLDYWNSDYRDDPDYPMPNWVQALQKHVSNL